MDMEKIRDERREYLGEKVTRDAEDVRQEIAENLKMWKRVAVVARGAKSSDDWEYVAELLDTMGDDLMPSASIHDEAIGLCHDLHQLETGMIVI